MSCSWNARSPESVLSPADFALATAVSRIVVPALRVRVNACSSACAIWLIRAKLVSSSGYEAAIRSFDTVSRSVIAASCTPSSRTERITRRSRRRST